jgi:ribonuclease HI
MMKDVVLHTDGACSGNPGPGGWCAILSWNGSERVLRGKNIHTTNNRMELAAVIGGLEALKEPCRVTIFTDSQYVIDVASPRCRRRANHDLLYELDALCTVHDVTFRHVRGHDGDPTNERCDRIARQERDRARKMAKQEGVT